MSISPHSSLVSFLLFSSCVLNFFMLPNYKSLQLFYNLLCFSFCTVCLCLLLHFIFFPYFLFPLFLFLVATSAHLNFLRSTRDTSVLSCLFVGSFFQAFYIYNMYSFFLFPSFGCHLPLDLPSLLVLLDCHTAQTNPFNGPINWPKLFFNKLLCLV